MLWYFIGVVYKDGVVLLAEKIITTSINTGLVTK